MHDEPRVVPPLNFILFYLTTLYAYPTGRFYNVVVRDF